MGALTRLDAQYSVLSKQQHVLLQMLDKMETEEAALVKALAVTTESSNNPTSAKRPTATIQRQRDQAAVSRLEEAMNTMQDFSSSSEEEEEPEVDMEVDDGDEQATIGTDQ